MTPRVGMVLAAGLGTRMRPLTDSRPKPLVEVGGKALIDHALDRFAASGVKKAVVNVHYLANMLEAHLAKRTDPEIIISDERALLLETGGGLKRARSALEPGPAFCVNTDAILIDAPDGEACAALAEAWNSDSMDALLLLVPHARASGYEGAGDFDLDADGRLNFRTRTYADYIFTGLQIISLSTLDGAPEGPFSTRLLWEAARKRGRLFGIPYSGYWIHVGEPDAVAIAEAKLAEASPGR